MKFDYRTQSFVPAAPGWVVWLSNAHSPKPWRSALAGWVIEDEVERGYDGEATPTGDRRVVPGWFVDGEIESGRWDNDLLTMVVGPGDEDPPTDHVIATWHQDHVARVAAREAERRAKADGGAA